jgi:hypothetical protein
VIPCRERPAGSAHHVNGPRKVRSTTPGDDDAEAPASEALGKGLGNDPRPSSCRQPDRVGRGSGGHDRAREGRRRGDARARCRTEADADGAGRARLQLRGPGRRPGTHCRCSQATVTGAPVNPRSGAASPDSTLPPRSGRTRPTPPSATAHTPTADRSSFDCPRGTYGSIAKTESQIARPCDPPEVCHFTCASPAISSAPDSVPRGENCSARGPPNRRSTHVCRRGAALRADRRAQLRAERAQTRCTEPACRSRGYRERNAPRVAGEGHRC